MGVVKRFWRPIAALLAILLLVAVGPGMQPGAWADQVTGNLVYAWNDTLIDIVGDLVDAGGGARAGKDDVHGYYVVSVGVVPAGSDMTKAYTSARLEALRMMNEFINGVLVSGGASSAAAGRGDRRVQEFHSVVVERFKGHINGARVWRQGPVGKKVFVVLLLDEAGLKARERFRSHGGGGHTPATTVVPAPRNGAMAGPTASRRETVEADGFAPLEGASISAARRAAIRDALRNAIEKVNGVAIRGRAGRLGKHIAQIIASQSEGFIATYKVVDEERRGADYHVRVRAVVDTAGVLKAVDLYLRALGAPRFEVQAPPRYRNWLTARLKGMGFEMVEPGSRATHLFRMEVRQDPVPNPMGGPPGFATEATVTLVDLANGEELLTVRNPGPERTAVFVAPERVARAASERLALKRLAKVLEKEIVTALAERARKGQIYEIVVEGAAPLDLDLFRHNLHGNSEAEVVAWRWNPGQELILQCRFPGSLSQLLDSILDELEASYTAEGMGRRARLVRSGSRRAVFQIVKQDQGGGHGE